LSLEFNLAAADAKVTDGAIVEADDLAPAMGAAPPFGQEPAERSKTEGSPGHDAKEAPGASPALSGVYLQFEGGSQVKKKPAVDQGG
jgi:hypothetical protein